MASIQRKWGYSISPKGSSSDDSDKEHDGPALVIQSPQKGWGYSVDDSSSDDDDIVKLESVKLAEGVKHYPRFARVESDSSGDDEGDERALRTESDFVASGFDGVHDNDCMTENEKSESKLNDIILCEHEDVDEVTTTTSVFVTSFDSLLSRQKASSSFTIDVASDEGNSESDSQNMSSTIDEQCKGTHFSHILSIVAPDGDACDGDVAAEGDGDDNDPNEARKKSKKKKKKKKKTSTSMEATEVTEFATVSKQAVLDALDAEDEFRKSQQLHETEEQGMQDTEQVMLESILAEAIAYVGGDVNAPSSLTEDMLIGLEKVTEEQAALPTSSRKSKNHKKKQKKKSAAAASKQEVLDALDAEDKSRKCQHQLQEEGHDEVGDGSHPLPVSPVALEDEISHVAPVALEDEISHAAPVALEDEISHVAPVATTTALPTNESDTSGGNCIQYPAASGKAMIAVCDEDHGVETASENCDVLIIDEKFLEGTILSTAAAATAADANAVQSSVLGASKGLAPTWRHGISLADMSSSSDDNGDDQSDAESDGGVMESGPQLGRMDRTVGNDCSNGDSSDDSSEDDELMRSKFVNKADTSLSTGVCSSTSGGEVKPWQRRDIPLSSSSDSDNDD
jgi:hypothetical protein